MTTTVNYDRYGIGVPVIHWTAVIVSAAMVLAGFSALVAAL